MRLEHDEERTLLHFFRQQEARTHLTILNFDRLVASTVEEMVRRTMELARNKNYCGENHHPHYINTLQKLKHGKNTSFGHGNHGA